MKMLRNVRNQGKGNCYVVVLIKKKKSIGHGWNLKDIIRKIDKEINPKSWLRNEFDTHRHQHNMKRQVRIKLNWK